MVEPIINLADVQPVKHPALLDRDDIASDVFML
jgi:hypothetical protein